MGRSTGYPCLLRGAALEFDVVDCGNGVLRVEGARLIERPETVDGAALEPSAPLIASALESALQSLDASPWRAAALRVDGETMRVLAWCSGEHAG